MDWLKRLRRGASGFTLIEIAIVVAIIGLLLLIALPLYSGARLRAYVAEARQLTSEWKTLGWSCLVEKSFDERSCDSSTELNWTLPGDSGAWIWSTAVFACGNTATVSPTVAAATCTANEVGNNAYLAVRVPRQPSIQGLNNDYVLVLRSNTGKIQESPADGTTVPTP